MRITVLGSGTSSGVPMIGCECKVCKSSNPKNKRTRSSAAVEINDRVFLLDTSTDLRQQALENDLQRVDAVLFTHAHADHIHGIDELRVYNLRQLAPIPCYGNAAIGEKISKYFNYVFDQGESESFRPYLEFQRVEGEFELFGVNVIPVPLLHGRMPVLGYRIGDFAYLTDVSRIPDTSWCLLDNLECVILDALRIWPHKTHFSIAQALEVIERLRPRRAALTHLSHVIDYDTVSMDLPKGTALGYDGMIIDL